MSNRQNRTRKKNVPDLTDFVKKTKLSDLENKIWDVSSLAARTALTVVENKIPIVFFQLKKQIITQKLVSLKRNLLIIIMISFTAPEFNTLGAIVFNARLAQANLITKTDFDAKLSSLNRKTSSNKTKHLLVKNELKKLKHLIQVVL